jgi:uncharacterized damage-inducible protein DinB
MQRSDAVALLDRAVAATVPFFAADAAVQARAYAPGKWTLRQVLLHLADCQVVYLDRLCRTAAEDKPLLLAFDENRWADRLAYADRDLALAGRLFAATSATIADLARRLPAEIDGRNAVHSEAGLHSFAEFLTWSAQHVAHHLEQVRAAAEGRTWARPAAKA